MDKQEYIQFIIQNVLNDIVNRFDKSEIDRDNHILYSFDNMFNDRHYSNLDGFNFYPSSQKDRCHEIAFFTSLIGKRWQLKANNKITFDLMFKYIIQHCQGNCSKLTKTVVIIVDNWDDDIANFWQANLDQIKSNGIEIELRYFTGKIVQQSKL